MYIIVLMHNYLKRYGEPETIFNENNKSMIRMVHEPNETSPYINLIGVQKHLTHHLNAVQKTNGKVISAKGVGEQIPCPPLSNIENAQNYRPKSLMRVVCKILEKIFRKQMLIRSYKLQPLSQPIH